MSFDAAAIANGALGDDSASDVAGALVDLTQQSMLAALSVKVLSIADRTPGTLLDVRA